MNYESDSMWSDDDYLDDEEDLTREERLRLIQAGAIEGGEYEGDEPWPFGNDPDETNQDALARLAREYRETQLEEEIDPVAIIAMHERYQFPDSEDLPMDDTDSDSDADSEIDLLDDDDHDPLDENGNPSFDFEGILYRIHQCRAIARRQTEYDGQQTMLRMVYMFHRSGLPDSEINRAMSEPSLTPNQFESLRRERVEYNRLSIIWDKLDRLKEELAWRRQFETGITERSRVAAVAFAISHPEVNARWIEHRMTVFNVTSYPARQVAMSLWFQGLTEELREALNDVLDHLCAVSELGRQIRAHRMATGTDPAQWLTESFMPHSHELYEGHDDTDPDQREIRYGFETYDNDAPVVFKGAGVFEPPEDDLPLERVGTLISLLFLHSERARREIQPGGNVDGMLNLASVANWFNGASQWARDNLLDQVSEEAQADVAGVFDDFAREHDPVTALRTLHMYQLRTVWR